PARCGGPCSQEMLSMSERVAVYGTLKRGQGNFHLLTTSRYLGPDTLDGLCLYDLGPYPGARGAVAGQTIEVEVFEVDAATMAALDALEEYVSHAPDTGMYDRILVNSRFGPAWVYLYNLSVEGCQRVAGGCWTAAG